VALQSLVRKYCPPVEVVPADEPSGRSNPSLGILPTLS
jgi:hypothetical protein